MQKYGALKKVQNTNMFHKSNFSCVWLDTSVMNKKFHKSLKAEKKSILTSLKKGI